jgi:hypothetical protein
VLHKVQIKHRQHIPHGNSQKTSMHPGNQGQSLVDIVQMFCDSDHHNCCYRDEKEWRHRVSTRDRERERRDESEMK